MKTFPRRASVALLVLGILCLSPAGATDVRAQATAVDAAATQALKRMTDYLGSLQQFSVLTETTLEDLLDSGQRVDFGVSATVIIGRPNKLRSERVGDLTSQFFYYDGKTLTLYNPADAVYATEPAPGTIEGTLDFAREELGLTIPVADLVYRNAFPLLMQDVTFAALVGKAMVSGVRCDHLVFSRPGVDFQVWVADEGQPLPYKYVVTDTGTPARLSIATVMSDWNAEPNVADSEFTFEPPQGAKAITFMRIETSSGASR